MKYSENFERDYAWYYKYKNIFHFDGSFDKVFSYDEYEGYNAKHCFYMFDSQGKLLTTNEPELLQQIFKCKGSINFHIKMWAEARADGTLSLLEFNNTKDNELRVLEWVNKEPVYIKDIKTQYELLDWMVDAVEKQKWKYYK